MKTPPKTGFLTRCSAKGVNVTDAITALYEMQTRPPQLSTETKSVLTTLGRDETIDAIMAEHDRRITEWDGR